MSDPSTALAVLDRPTPAPLAIPELVFTEEHLAQIKRMYAKRLTPEQYDLFLWLSQRQALDPLKKQIHAVVRNVKNRDGGWDKTMVIIVGIDGYRILADRTGLFAGQGGPWWCGPDGEWRDIWLGGEREYPTAAKVEVHRVGWKAPLISVAKWSSFAQKDSKGNLSGKWAEMPDHMLAIAAERHALRRAFPDLLEDMRAGVQRPVLIEVEGERIIDATSRPTPPKLALPAMTAPASVIDQATAAVPDWAADNHLEDDPTVEDGDYADLPSDDDLQLEEFRTALRAQRNAAGLHAIKAEADRMGYGPAIQAEYEELLRTYPETRRRIV